MAIHITTGTNNIGFADAILITNNIALTGTITVATVASTIDGGVGGATLAVITNPTVGESHTLRGLRSQGTITVTPSATADITVQKLSPQASGT